LDNKKFVIGTTYSNLFGTIFGFNGTPYEILYTYPDNHHEISSLQPNLPVLYLETKDPNLEDSHTYTLVTSPYGVDNGIFTISGNKILAKTAKKFQNEFKVSVRSTDPSNLHYEKDILIQIPNIEMPHTQHGPTAIGFLYSPQGLSPDLKLITKNLFLGHFNTTHSNACDTFTYELMPSHGESLCGDWEKFF
jgi:hypothetical protein